MSADDFDDVFNIKDVVSTTSPSASTMYNCNVLDDMLTSVSSSAIPVSTHIHKSPMLANCSHSNTLDDLFGVDLNQSSITTSMSGTHNIGSENSFDDFFSSSSVISTSNQTGLTEFQSVASSHSNSNGASDCIVFSDDLGFSNTIQPIVNSRKIENDDFLCDMNSSNVPDADFDAHNSPLPALGSVDLNQSSITTSMSGTHNIGSENSFDDFFSSSSVISTSNQTGLTEFQSVASSHSNSNGASDCIVFSDDLGFSNTIQPIVNSRKIENDDFLCDMNSSNVLDADFDSHNSPLPALGNDITTKSSVDFDFNAFNSVVVGSSVPTSYHGQFSRNLLESDQSTISISEEIVPSSESQHSVNDVIVPSRNSDDSSIEYLYGEKENPGLDSVVASLSDAFSYESTDDNYFNSVPTPREAENSQSSFADFAFSNSKDDVNESIVNNNTIQSMLSSPFAINDEDLDVHFGQINSDDFEMSSISVAVPTVDSNDDLLLCSESVPSIIETPSNYFDFVSVSDSTYDSPVAVLKAADAQFPEHRQSLEEAIQETQDYSTFNNNNKDSILNDEDYGCPDAVLEAADAPFPEHRQSLEEAILEEDAITAVSVSSINYFTCSSAPEIIATSIDNVSFKIATNEDLVSNSNNLMENNTSEDLFASVNTENRSDIDDSVFNPFSAPLPNFESNSSSAFWSNEQTSITSGDMGLISSSATIQDNFIAVEKSSNDDAFEEPLNINWPTETQSSTFDNITVSSSYDSCAIGLNVQHFSTSNFKSSQAETGDESSDSPFTNELKSASVNTAVGSFEILSQPSSMKVEVSSSNKITKSPSNDMSFPNISLLSGPGVHMENTLSPPDISHYNKDSQFVDASSILNDAFSVSINDDGSDDDNSETNSTGGVHEYASKGVISEDFNEDDISGGSVVVIKAHDGADYGDSIHVVSSSDFSLSNEKIGLDPYATSSTSAADAQAQRLLPSSVCDDPLRITEIMIQYQEDASVQRRGCYALTKLVSTLDENTIQKIIDCSALQTVLVAMTKFVAISGVQACGCRFLSTFCAFSEKNRLMISNAGGASTAVRAMRLHEQVIEIQREGCLLIASLTLETPSTALDAGKAGCAASVVAAMEQFEHDHEVQRQGCRAILGLLSVDPGTKASSPAATFEGVSRCVQNNAVEVLLVALVNHSSRPDVVRWSCKALASLFNPNKSSQQWAGEAGSIAVDADAKDLITSAQSLHQHDTTVQESANDALRLLENTAVVSVNNSVSKKGPGRFICLHRADSGKKKCLIQ